MVLVNAATDAFVVTLLLALVPAVYLFRLPNDAPARARLSALLLVHSVYILYVLFILAPQNIFVQLNIPLNVPADKIRAAIIAHAPLDPGTPLPKPLETLLTRLTSSDTRTVFVRFVPIYLSNHTTRILTLARQVRPERRARLRVLQDPQ